MKIFLQKQIIVSFFIFNCFLFSFCFSEDIEFGKFYIQNSSKEINYKIELPNNYIEKIFIDIIIYVGDVEVFFNNRIPYKQILSVNHIFYKVEINENPKLFLFVVKAKVKSYYLLFTNYEQNNIDDSLMTNELQTGFSYLINVNSFQRDENNEYSKIIKFNQKYFNEKKPIMSSFFSLNCKFDIKQIYKNNEKGIIYKDIKKYENFFHDLIKPEDTEKYNDILEYKITIAENDPTTYEGHLCTLFASSVEISNKYEENINDIIIPDNNPQQVMFTNDVKHVSYGYMHLELEKGLMIKFIPIHIAQYKIRLYFDHLKREKEEIIVGKNVIYIKPEEWSDKCKDEKKGCYIQLDITLEKIKDNENPILEFSFQMIETNSVSYIPKRILKNDFLHNNNSQYYYTDIGSSEEGFITVNFLRGIGKVFFKIVEEKEVIENGDWRGKYSFTDDIKEFYYSKNRAQFDESKNCKNGCYLLIKIFSNFNNTEQITDVNFPFSIIVNSFQRNIFQYYNDERMPVIKIQNDEFVVGALRYAGEGQTILEFYSILLNSNAKSVLIDFQSDTASLYINVGNKKPSTGQNDFNHEPKGKDGIYIISGEKILELWNKKENKNFTGLKDIILTLGIKTKVKNSNSANLFGFIVRLMNETENDIYRVDSDKKALCNTKMISKGKYRCVYSIDNYNLNSENYLLIYLIPQNKSALFKIYGKFINQTDYEFIPETKLKELIPNEGNKNISNQNLNEDYLLIKEGFGNLLLTVETDIDTTVELISSNYLNQKIVFINDYEPKLFFGFTNEIFKIKFPNDGNLDYMVNIKCIAGSADIYWDLSPGNIFHLEGKDDRISINTEKLTKNNNLNFIPKANIKENIGIIFYLKIQPRIYQLNFDELILDSSSNYFYSGNDLPIYYFAPIPHSILDNNEYYEISFTFDFLENNKKIKKYYEDIPFFFDSYIVDYDIILRTKNEPEEITVQRTNYIKGYYDPLLKSGYIKIAKDNIDGNYVEKERPYLFLIINKTKRNEKEVYNSYSLEVSSIKNDQESPVSELSYQFGKLEIDQKERIYKLRVDNSFKYIFIKFSCTNNNVLSIEIDGRKLIKKVTEYGRTIYSLETKRNDLILFLKIKRLNNKASEEYFTFQYVHENNDDIIKEYKIIKSSKLNITKNLIEKENIEEIQRVDFTISLNPVENYENYNITYLVRGIDTSINNNYKLKKEDLSLKFLSNPYYLEYNNPKVNENKTLIFNLDNTTDNVKYIQVIAQIKDKKKERLEYLSYDIYSEVYDEDDEEDKDKKILALVIAFGSFILIIVIILVIIVITYHLKNKNLVDKVNKISFSMDRDSKAESESSEDLLLGKRNNFLKN